MSKTKIFTSEYKGHPTISVWNIDENGNKVGKYPVASMGIKKSLAFLSHHNEILEFVKEHITQEQEG